MGDRDQQVSALRSLGYVRAYSPTFVAIECNRLNPLDTNRLRLYLAAMAEKVERLAEVVPEGTVTYSQIEAVLKELYGIGFYPPRLAITTVLHAFVNEETT